MTEEHQPARTAADLIATLRGRGLSQSEIARELGRSPRMVRAVERGEKPGHVYVAALAQLVDRGRVSTPPLRRRARDGRLAKVRAPASSEEPIVTPTERQPRGRFRHETAYLAGGGRHHTVQVPLKGRQGRAKGKEALLSVARSIAKGQARGTRRIHFNAVLGNGQSIPIGEKGGYRISTILAAWHEWDDDPFAWVMNEIAERYPAVAAGEDGSDVLTIEIIDPGQ